MCESPRITASEDHSVRELDENGPNMSDQTSTPNDLSIYQTDWCPFCRRVRSAIRQLGVDIELRDVSEDLSRLQELVEATGREMVPCLRIETPSGDEGVSDVQWMHESANIIAYLKQRFR